MDMTKLPAQHDMVLALLAILIVCRTAATFHLAAECASRAQVLVCEFRHVVVFNLLARTKNNLHGPRRFVNMLAGLLQRDTYSYMWIIAFASNDHYD